MVDAYMENWELVYGQAGAVIVKQNDKEDQFVVKYWGNEGVQRAKDFRGRTQDNRHFVLYGVLTNLGHRVNMLWSFEERYMYDKSRYDTIWMQLTGKNPTGKEMTEYIPNEHVPHYDNCRDKRWR